jgi:D-alanyl-D-alanine carboxypeptidase (penicillin-binding protein 5/6)
MIYFFYVCIFLGMIPLSCVFSLQVDVAAKGAVLMNAKTGAVLWEKNAHVPLEPASTTKVATALYALERKGEALDEMVVASADAVMSVPEAQLTEGTHPPYRLDSRGTSMWLLPREAMPLRTLLEGLLLVSGNDAANVIAEHISSNIPRFMEELNAFLKTKGCLHTHFCNPHGLTWPGHKTTAYDLALIARAFLQHEELRRICALKENVRPKTNKQPQTVMPQFNRLLKPGRFFYPKAIGIKTGFARAAGHCIVAAAADKDRELIAVLLGCNSGAQRFQGVIELFEKAFQEQKVSRTLFSQGFDRFPRVLKGAKRPLQALLMGDLTLEYYPSEEPIIKSRIVWDQLVLPLRAQQRVGVIEILSSEGSVLTAAPLYAEEAVESTWSYQMEQRSLLLFPIGVALVYASYLIFHRKRRKRSMN